MESNSLNINWYPGHMKKTRELMVNNLKLIDVVVEMLDARIPFSSKNPDIDEIIGDKPKVVVFNKNDLANETITKQWVDYYGELGIKAIPIDANKGTGINSLIKECQTQASQKMKKNISKGIQNKSIRLMIVGVPNVGKSSLINRLSGRKSTQIGDRPGVTKGKQWVRLKGNLELLDTPGILWPKFDDEDVALNLAFTRAIKDEILDVETLGLKLIERLMEINPEALKTRYKLDVISDNPLEVMDGIAFKRGFIMARKEIDYTRTALTILNEFREGILGKISLEIP